MGEHVTNFAGQINDDPTAHAPRAFLYDALQEAGTPPELAQAVHTPGSGELQQHPDGFPVWVPHVLHANARRLNEGRVGFVGHPLNTRSASIHPGVVIPGSHFLMLRGDTDMHHENPGPDFNAGLTLEEATRRAHDHVYGPEGARHALARAKPIGTKRNVGPEVARLLPTESNMPASHEAAIAHARDLAGVLAKPTVGEAVPTVTRRKPSLAVQDLIGLKPNKNAEYGRALATAHGRIPFQGEESLRHNPDLDAAFDEAFGPAPAPTTADARHNELLDEAFGPAPSKPVAHPWLAKTRLGAHLEELMRHQHGAIAAAARAAYTQSDRHALARLGKALEGSGHRLENAYNWQTAQGKLTADQALHAHLGKTEAAKRYSVADIAKRIEAKPEKHLAAIAHLYGGDTAEALRGIKRLVDRHADHRELDTGRADRNGEDYLSYLSGDEHARLSRPVTERLKASADTFKGREAERKAREAAATPELDRMQGLIQSAKPAADHNPIPTASRNLFAKALLDAGYHRHAVPALMAKPGASQAWHRTVAAPLYAAARRATPEERVAHAKAAGHEAIGLLRAWGHLPTPGHDPLAGVPSLHEARGGEVHRRPEEVERIAAEAYRRPPNGFVELDEEPRELAPHEYHELGRAQLTGEAAGLHKWALRQKDYRRALDAVEARGNPAMAKAAKRIRQSLTKRGSTR